MSVSVEKINILIVDDTPSNLVALEAILNDPEYNLIQATSAKEAFKLSDQMTFALALIDVQMPILNGFELAQMIRSKNKSTVLPIIFLTAALPSDQIIENAYDLGAVDFIFKPLNVKALRAKVLFFVDLYKKNFELTRSKDLERQKLVSEFSGLANSISQLAWMADETGFIYWYNEKWFNYTGTTLEEMKGWGWEKVHHPTYVADVTSKWAYHLKHGIPWEDTFPLRSAEGEYRWFLSRANPIYDENKKIIRWVGTNTDIHDQVQSEKQLNTIIDYMTEGVLITDGTGKILLWNRSALMIHGFERMEDLYEHLSIFTNSFKTYKLDGSTLDYADWPLVKVMNGETLNNYEIIVERPDANIKFIASYNGAPVKDESGNIVMAIVTLRDVTSKIKNENELLNAIKVRDEFLSLASHELKTPLTTLKIQAQLLNRSIAKNDPALITVDKLTGFASQSEAQIAKLNRLIDDLLDVSRINTGKLTFKKETFDLCKLIKDLTARMESQFISAKYDPPKLHISCAAAEGRWDLMRIEQALSNLLTNAIRYGKRKQIDIYVDALADAVKIRIQDKGIGISPENFKKIFQRFERVSDTDEVTGLGLGLFLTKQVVEAHHGKIWVESTLGKGSIFTIELPRKVND